jgi:hypothetical protein
MCSTCAIIPAAETIDLPDASMTSSRIHIGRIVRDPAAGSRAPSQLIIKRIGRRILA